MIKKAFEQARTDDEAQVDYERLAFIFPVINDDVNTLAAWSAMSPLRAKGDDGPENGNASPTTDSTPDGSAEPAATAAAIEKDHASEELDEDNSQHGLPEDKKDSDELTGNLVFYCDGRCGRRWDYADDIWVCRDCLCVQLDTGCLEKLRRGGLPIAICHPKHEHLHVPPSDEHAWKANSSADLKVGSEIMSRDVWLSKLRQEWGIAK